MGFPNSLTPLQDKFFDKWSLPHGLVGAAYALLGFDAKSCMIASLGWELLENMDIIPRSEWWDESFANTVGDVVANMIGYYVVKKVIEGNQ